MLFVVAVRCLLQFDCRLMFDVCCSWVVVGCLLCAVRGLMFDVGCLFDNCCVLFVVCSLFVV